MDNSKYTFDTFMENNFNHLALAACRAITAHHDKYCSPLWLYGPSGCGKSHLLKAICHAIEGYKALTVQCLTAKELAEALLEPLRGNSTMWHSIENADILLVDNAEYLLYKTSTQQELAELFINKHIKGKQVVLASICPPKELTVLSKMMREQIDDMVFVAIPLAYKEE